MTNRVIFIEIVLRSVQIVPAWYFFEQAEVCQHRCGSSRDACRTVYENIHVLVASDVVHHLGDFEYLLGVIFGWELQVIDVEVLYCKVFNVYYWVFGQIDYHLDVLHEQLGHILIGFWRASNEDSALVFHTFFHLNFVYMEFPAEIKICFVQLAIYDPDNISVDPCIIFWISKLTGISFWILNCHNTTRMTLYLIVGLVLITDIVVAFDQSLFPILIQKSIVELPWSSIYAIFFLIVNLIFTRLVHLDFVWVKDTFVLDGVPSAKFRAWAPHTDLILMVLLGIIHRKLELVFFPSVDKLHMLDHFIIFSSFGRRQNLKISDPVKPFLKIKKSLVIFMKYHILVLEYIFFFGDEDRLDGCPIMVISPCKVAFELCPVA